jgi:nucleoside-diphosphate-sugar epimerase
MARRVGQERGVEVVVIRPGMVYGPGSRGWTVNMVRLLQRRVPAVLGDGSGHAQPVYIDNLVEGMILAAERPGIGGEAFNFVDRPLPWRDFFGYYGRMCGRKPLRLPLGLAKVGLGVYRWMSGRRESSGSLLAYYTAKAVYPMEKAEQLLGYRPGVSIEEGMGRTEVWLREAGYLG